MGEHPIVGRAQEREAAENVGRNPTANPTMGDIIAQRFSRRDMIRGTLAVTAIGATVSPLALATAARAQAATPGFAFTELDVGVDEKMHVAPGYKAQVLISWGDPIKTGGPAFDPNAQTVEKQKQQFGYNNDYVGYFPIDGSSERGLLCINHEYTNEELMFPGAAAKITKDDKFGYLTKDVAEIEMAAHGGCVLEVRKAPAGWQVVTDSRYNRRITALDTEMAITGPAAGSERLKTAEDPTGRKVVGMVNNCAGGMTPWGTWLSAEENFNGYFMGKIEDGSPEARNYKRYGLGAPEYGWGKWQARFDIQKEPNSANRFGWMVEIDPFDPASTPKKRTALGRFKHEGAETIVNKDGRVVAYVGDDERFDYVYKFVTAGRLDPQNRAANMDLLDSGTLYVARFDADGTVAWLPVVHGQGPLTEANGFKSQADVLIETRRAGDLLGATKMDRPEDVQANARTGKVYVMLTNNTRREDSQVDPINPRAKNAFGHIVELTPPDGDHAATTARWDILVKCGDPKVAAVGATFSSATTAAGWFGMPDNCAIDGQGRLWISTDGNSPKATGRTDGLWALETDGAGRATSKCFFHVPLGAELCGPMFTPDDKTLFLAIQHPGEEDADGKPGTFEAPATRWPDFKAGIPPRPAIVVVTKDDGGVIAS